MNQDYKEEYLDYLVGMSEWDQAASVIEQILNDEAYTSAAGKTKFDFLSQLCDIISLHPKEIVRKVLMTDWVEIDRLCRHNPAWDKEVFGRNRDTLDSVC